MKMALPPKAIFISHLSIPCSVLSHRESGIQPGTLWALNRHLGELMEEQKG